MQYITPDQTLFFCITKYLCKDINRDKVLKKKVLIKILLTHNFTVIRDEEAISIFSVGGLICLFAEQTKVL